MNPSNDLEKIIANSSHFNSFSKKDYEIVITRFNGDISWSDSLNNIRTVYDKGLKFNDSSILIPNFGVSEEVILRHIINNYDNLARITLFTQQAIGDRIDQPCYPICDYLSIDSNEFLGFERPLHYPDTWKIEYLPPTDVGSSIFTLYSFSKFILGMSGSLKSRSWVAGSYFSVGRDRILAKPLGYYKYIYEACNFERGNGCNHYNGSVVEEVYFLERLFWSIFNLEEQFPIIVDF